MVYASSSYILAALKRYFPPSSTLPPAKLRLAPEIYEHSRKSSFIQERSIFENYMEDLLATYLSM
jgi:hypothetical protein